MSNPELKRLSAALDVKASPRGEIEGYASVFGNKDNGGDIVVKGAFVESLDSGRKPKMLWQHDPEKVIGIWDEMKEDGTGLRVKGRILTETHYGKEAAALLKEGALDGLSIGYRVADGGAKRDQKGNRIIEKAELWEVSLVTFPMNERATVTGYKSLQSQADVERILKAAGIPNRAAQKIAAGGWPALRGDEPTGAEMKELSELIEQTGARVRLNMKGHANGTH